MHAGDAVARQLVEQADRPVEICALGEFVPEFDVGAQAVGERSDGLDTRG